jgi:ATP-dependent exoDNAse (exonuclease V) beta subunit
MIITKKYGISLPITPTSKQESFIVALSKRDEKQETLLERIRLYYVALTRAKEKIILMHRFDEKRKRKATLKKCSTFTDLNCFINLDSIARPVFDERTLLVNQAKDIPLRHYELKQIPTPTYEKIEHKKASKDMSDNAYLAVVEFGKRMHYLLEILDYETKDISFVTDKKEVKYLNNILNHELFKNVKNNQLLHEYNFYDEVNDVNGVIDCIIKKEDSIVIIDFKRKNISDKEYETQLHIYKDYVSQTTDKPIKLYLLSIIDGVAKEVI